VPVTTPGANDWKALAASASSHLVTPALAIGLRESEGVPEAFAEYLAAILELNGIRNALILDELHFAANRLNAAGMVPMILKSGASLVANLYPDPGARVLVDIDLLLPPDQLPEAVRILEESGFDAMEQKVWRPMKSHHLPPLYHADWPAAIELHEHPVSERIRALVPTQDYYARGSSAEFRGTKLLLPDPTDRVIHHVAHAQLLDGAYRRGFPELRQMLELAILQVRCGSRIDWPEVRRRFAQNGAEHILSDTVGLLLSLFEVATPITTPEAEIAARQRLRRHLERPQTARRAQMKEYVSSWLHRVRHEPATLINVLQPSGWPERIKRFSSRLNLRS